MNPLQKLRLSLNERLVGKTTDIFYDDKNLPFDGPLRPRQFAESDPTPNDAVIVQALTSGRPSQAGNGDLAVNFLANRQPVTPAPPSPDYRPTFGTRETSLPSPVWTPQRGSVSPPAPLPPPPPINNQRIAAAVNGSTGRAPVGDIPPERSLTLSNNSLAIPASGDGRAVVIAQPIVNDQVIVSALDTPIGASSRAVSNGSRSQVSATLDPVIGGNGAVLPSSGSARVSSSVEPLTAISFNAGGGRSRVKSGGNVFAEVSDEAIASPNQAANAPQVRQPVTNVTTPAGQPVSMPVGTQPNPVAAAPVAPPVSVPVAKPIASPGASLASTVGLPEPEIVIIRPPQQAPVPVPMNAASLSEFLTAIGAGGIMAGGLLYNQNRQGQPNPTVGGLYY